MLGAHPRWGSRRPAPCHGPHTSSQRVSFAGCAPSVSAIGDADVLP